MGESGRGRFRNIRNAPADAIRDVVRPYVEGDDWDRPHHLLVICWDGEKAWIDQDSQAPLTMHPDRIDLFIRSRSQHAFERHLAAAEQGAAPTLYAVAYVLESHLVHDLGPDASEWEQARLLRDRRERRFHERDDAVECRTAWAADIDGRLHCLALRADRPDEIACQTLNADGSGDGDIAAVTGHVVLWARAAAITNGILLHGDPMPTPGQPSAGAVVPLRSTAPHRDGSLQTGAPHARDPRRRAVPPRPAALGQGDTPPGARAQRV
jgi:hypothetical protein